MADTIIDGTLFNPEIIRYSAPKAGGSGGKSINILNSTTKTGVRISTPLMLTWGASDFVDATTGKGNGKFEMALQFPSTEYKTEETELFLKNMQDLENKIKADALTNSKDWFGKVHKNAEVVEALWTPMLKYSKDKTTGEQDLSKSPSIRIKMPFWDGVWKVEIYDEEGQKLFPNSATPSTTPIDLIQKGTNVAVIIQCGGLWFANGKFGITWKLVQAVVQKPKTSLAGTCFIKLKASDKEKLKTAPPAIEEERFEEICPTTNVEVEDSDEEQEQEQEQEEPVVVAAPVAAAEEPKKVVKKVVKKKV
jgi:hypothetical protein